LPKLSVVIIANNEEKNIARCLNSLEGLADEVLVVDSGSTDRTPEICRQMGAHVIAHPFEGYAEQKNFAMAQATHDYVLSLDADEALDEDSRTHLISLKKDFKADAYSFKRLNHYCGKWIRHGSWYPDKRIRLVHREKAAWKGEKVHETLVPLPNVKPEEVRGHILHYTINSLEEHLDQINRFSSLAAKAKFEKGKAFHSWQLIFTPSWRFIKEYLIKAGFLDGYHGFQLAVMAAYAGFLRYAKLRELWKDPQQASP